MTSQSSTQIQNPFHFLTSSSILLTPKIETYKNKNNHTCINQFEIIESIGRGLMWRVFKVRRYYYNDNNEVCYKYFAMKKAHIRTLKNMRFYVDDEVKDYFEKVVNEVKVFSLLQEEKDRFIEYYPRLYEVIYDHSHEEDVTFENESLYIVVDLCEGGGLMEIDYMKNRYYHNYLLYKHVNHKEYSWCYINNEDNEYDNDYDNDEKVECYVNHKGINENIEDEDKEKVFFFIFPQIIKGLIGLHSKGIVYSDLKPENLCLKIKNNDQSRFIVNQHKSNDKDNDFIENISITFVDFSISSILNMTSSLDIQNQGGTINFQSPEQFSSAKYNGFSSDIWALGVMIFLFFTEELPFDSESELETQIKIIKMQVNYEKFGFFQRKNPFSQFIFKVLTRIFVESKERVCLNEVYEMIMEYGGLKG